MAEVLGCPSLMNLERNYMPHALVHARHHSDSMRWRRHVESAKRWQRSTTWIARHQIAVEKSAHTAPPTACADCSVRCGDEPCGVERCHRATCDARSVPKV